MLEFRIDSTLLEANKGKVVRFIGKCESFNGPSNTATVIATGTINLALNGEDTLQVGKIYEITGKLNASNLVVQVYNVIEFSDNTNLEAAQKLAQFTHKVPELFY